MNKRLPALILALIFFLSPCAVIADVSVSLRVDRKKATLSDSITMVVSLSGARKSESPPVLNGLESFEVTRGGTSSRVEIINGRVNSGVDYTYALQPKKAGTFTIGPAEIMVNGKVTKSNTETLTIIELSQASGVDRGPLFLSASLSSEIVYVEEQVIYTLKLYLRTRISDISLNLPEAEHLSFKQLGKPVEYQSVYNGKSYQVLEVRYALIPFKEGIYGIRPSRMSMTVFQQGQKSPRSLFGDPFFSSGRPMTIASEPLKLTVLSLPEKGRPVNFNGLVGVYDIQSQLAPSEIKTGESATLTIFLNGRGNIKRLPDLRLPDMAHIKVYADQPVLKEEIDVNGLMGSKTMKWALVPEKEGEFEIPSLSVSFFDPKRQRYRAIKTPPFLLHVLPADKDQTYASLDVLKEQKTIETEKQAVKEVGHDILPVHTSIEALNTGTWYGMSKSFFWIILMSPVFIYLAAFSVLKFHKKTPGSMAVARAKKAAKTIIRQCRKGEITSNDLSLSILQYVNERFNLSHGSLTPDEAADILLSRGVRVETVETFRGVLQKLEDEVYTGKGHETCGLTEDMPKLIRLIEKEVR